MSLQKEKKKIIDFPKRKILKFPNNPEEVKDLLAQEQYLLDSLSIEETFSERVETRKQLRSVREAIREKISG